MSLKRSFKKTKKQDSRKMQINVSGQAFNSNTTVKLNLIHNILTIQIPEVRLDLFQNISSIKDVCAKKFGSECSSIRLYLQDREGNNICEMAEDDRDLGFYSPQDGYLIYVYDTNPNSLLKELEDLSQIEKYKMSDEDYDKLPNSFRKFKKEYITANLPKISEQNNQVSDEKFLNEALKLHVGGRCRLIEMNNRGEIKYIGKIADLGEGYFVGIKLDEPFGKNKGYVKGVKYFDCGENYGLFVRPNKIEEGDFPELDLDDEI